MNKVTPPVGFRRRGIVEHLDGISQDLQITAVKLHGFVYIPKLVLTVRPQLYNIHVTLLVYWMASRTIQNFNVLTSFIKYWSDEIRHVFWG